jgi:aspartokinase/homoserine dehydrogenase 1
VGVGTVGNTFIEQIKVQKQELMDRFKININLCGISNSKKMVFNENGIDLNSWRKKLDSSKEKADLDKYMERMIELNVPNAVLVDSTANAEISAKYHIPLNESIAVATPNKIAASGDIKYYNKLKELSSKRGVKYLYETNVGAGLPVVSTLQDLIKSGDTIIKIEAILSGTLNYVFENISAKSTLSEIVKEAMDLGLTEPDPRIDLSGLDVARKILILAREVGYTGELKDVDLKHFIPKSVVGSKDIESFWKLLPSCNESLEKERAAVAAKGAKWRYVACFEKNKCTVGVKEIVDGHPFYTLKGSDNMVLFTTERYKKQPLVIQGPGAGAEVTAAGLFADVIRMVN